MSDTSLRDTSQIEVAGEPAAMETMASRLTGRVAGARWEHRYGRVEKFVGLLAEARGLGAALGDTCLVHTDHDQVPAEVVGFRGDTCQLMPLRAVSGLRAGALVERVTTCLEANPDAASGRVIDALGQPLDQLGALPMVPAEPVAGSPNPFARRPIDKSLDVGVRALNGLLRIGVGQRVGIFAGSGVGKSVLLGMLARFTAADIVVVGLIGERGREVSEFVTDHLGDGLARAVVVASPADDSPALRLRAAWQATRIAEYHRARGRQVLLLMDSLTRVAQAQREIGLSLGEPAAAKGYTPSAFAVLPRLVERAGTSANGRGAITAFYTVLMEEDDLQDPIVDAARAILDGHIVLDRRLADLGIYPAIDVAGSISRLHNRLTTTEEREHSLWFKSRWRRYADQEDLINVGAHAPGVDPITDEAIARRADMLAFVCQSADDPVTIAGASAHLGAMASAVPTTGQGARSEQGSHQVNQVRI